MAQASTTTVRRDIYAEVTATILRQLEAGVRPWSQPWGEGGNVAAVMPRRITGEAYRGINVMILWGTMQERGYRQPTFLTFKQAQELGGHVRKGEKGSTVVYYSTFTREDDAGDEYSVPFLKSYSVFNVEQCDGLPERLYMQPKVGPDEVTGYYPAEAYGFFSRSPIKVQHGGSRAFYSPHHDTIAMPPAKSFWNVVDYYATLAHEHIHATGHTSRLDRTFGRKFGDNAYAFEELVAELGSAFLCADLNLSLTPREDHASYLATWVRVLKSDSRAIFKAASLAQKACDWLHEAAAPLAIAA